MASVNAISPSSSKQSARACDLKQDFDGRVGVVNGGGGFWGGGFGSRVGGSSTAALPFVRLDWTLLIAHVWSRG